MNIASWVILVCIGAWAVAAFRTVFFGKRRGCSCGAASNKAVDAGCPPSGCVGCGGCSYSFDALDADLNKELGTAASHTR